MRWRIFHSTARSVCGLGDAVNSLASPKRDQISVTIADKLGWSNVDLRSAMKCAMLDKMSLIPVVSSADASVRREIWKRLHT